MEFDIRTRKANNTNFVVADDNTNEVIRLVSIENAYTIHDARISTSSSKEIKQSKIIGPVSTTMRLVTLKDGDLSSFFDVIDESEDANNKTSNKQLLINNHTEANRGIIRKHLPLEYISGFCLLFKKITKGFGLVLELITSNKQRNSLYTTTGDYKVNNTFNKFYLHIPTIIPSPKNTKVFK